MKLALLGVSPLAVELGRSVADSSETLISLADAPAGSASLTAELPSVRVLDDWESLLQSPEIDAVVIAGPLGGGDEATTRTAREDQVRKLVQQGVPLLIMSPLCDAIIGYEWEMIRRDLGGCLYSYVPEMFHAAWARVAELSDVEQIVVEYHCRRPLALEVQAALWRDMVLLRQHLPEVRRVTATGPVAREGSPLDYTHLTVSLGGPTNCSVRWSVVANATTEHTKYSFLQREERTELAIDAQGNATWNGSPLESGTRRELIHALLIDVGRVIAKEKPADLGWLAACRYLEALEGVDRSLTRGRTIELHHEEISEASAFKGTMAVWGCLMLLLVLGIFIGMNIFLAVWNAGQKSSGSWLCFQLGILIPLAAFLLLQLLSFGIPGHEKRRRESNSQRGTEDTEGGRMNKE